MANTTLLPKWRSDRLPTVKDADQSNHVYTLMGARVITVHYNKIKQGVTWARVYRGKHNVIRILTPDDNIRRRSELRAGHLTRLCAKRIGDLTDRIADLEAEVKARKR